MLGNDLDLITNALQAGRRRHPSQIPLQTQVRQFWERFTGGDIAYAPEPIRLDPASPAYTWFRRLHGVAASDLFHVAHQQLVRDGADLL